MLGILNIEIEEKEKNKITNQKTSLLQGVLMERLDEEYAEQLHQNVLRPYSQNIIYRDGRHIWQVKTLDEEAYDKIILSLLHSDFENIHFQHNNADYKILNKNLVTSTRRELIEKYYFGECSKHVKIHFASPTAFKSEGKYIFYPDFRLIYQSLINRYDAFSKNEMIGNEEVLRQLVEYTEVLQYQLKSVAFHLEGIKIPAFIGTVLLRINGPQALVNLATLLFQYGVYSGVGIKTAMGMGAIEIIGKGEENDR